MTDYWEENTDKRIQSGYYSYRYRNIRFNVREPVLDLGGGNGIFLRHIGVRNAVIIDIEGGTSLLSPYYHFINKDLNEYLAYYPDNKFKTIFCMETLEHLDEPLRLLQQAKNLLSDDGILYISVPYTELDKERRAGITAHVNRWTKKEFQNMLEDLGFNVRFIYKRRRYWNLAFWIPHCFLVAECRRRR